MLLAPALCNKAEAEGVNVILPTTVVLYAEGSKVVPPTVILVIAPRQVALSVKVTSNAPSTVAPTAADNVGAIMAAGTISPVERI